ncbi:MAG: hypothetical protein DRH37_01735 [Deltaproteobacteria bacterium]|nr:MAG: hypothetical protein DRH37_01735 [Deltaproteobacteria bacterium]
MSSPFRPKFIIYKNSKKNDMFSATFFGKECQTNDTRVWAEPDLRKSFSLGKPNLRLQGQDMV